jgi:hypothetical protein
MKNITIILAFIFSINSWAVAPYGIKGQAQSGTLYSNIHQFPNNQVTNTGGINALVETGNKNILINPSFEHLTFSTGWTNSAGTFTEETVIDIDGLKSAKLVLSSQTMSLTQSSTLYAAQFADGVQGLASVRVKSDVALKVCAIQAGVVSSSLCVDVQANNKWGLYKVPFILGATSNGISIASTGAVSGTVYIDDAFVGAVDLSATVDASRIAGESYFEGVAGCSWNRTSTSVGQFTASAACPGPTIARSSMGLWQTTDTDLPVQTINNLPAGKYKATFILNQQYVTTAQSTTMTIFDGLTSCESQSGNNGTSAMATVVSCVFEYSSSGNRSFEVRAASVSGTVIVANSQSSPRMSTKFILEYFGSSTTYSSNNADTDWAACNFSTLAWNGLGTVSGVDIKCKRQGGDLLMSGRFVSGVAVAAQVQIPMPLWNGVQLNIRSSFTTLNNILGGASRNVSSAGNNDFSLFTIASQPTYLVVGVYNNIGEAPLSAQQGTQILASGQVVSMNARIPIEGWQNSNIIIGQFNGLESCTDSYECESLFTAQISSTGVVSGENIDWINGNCSMTLGAASCTLKTGLAGSGSNLTNAMNCGVTGVAATRIPIIASSGSSTVVFVLENTVGASTASNMSVYCQKQGVDYIGKTAKAVASDQNIRTPGIVKSVLYSAELSASGVVSSERGDFINGNCTNAAPSICTFNSGAFASTPNCSVTSNGGTLGTFCQFGAKPSTSSASITCANDSGGNFTTSLIKTIICHGEAP